MNIALFEDSAWRQLLPLTWLRPCGELRCGRDSLGSAIARSLNGQIRRRFERPDLYRGHDADAPADTISGDGVFVNGRALFSGPTAPPPPGVAWMAGARLIAAGVSQAQFNAPLTYETFSEDARRQAWCAQFRVEPPPAAVRLIEHPWELVLANRDVLLRQLVDGGVHEGCVHPGAHLLNPGVIRIAPGSVIKAGVVLDAEAGPIEIDREVTVSPNAVIEGPCYIGPQTIIRAGAYIRANTSIGPACRVGGEVDGCIIHGYSNKQHDGFLGHSYVGEWVNLGAGTVNSDLKNTYGTIRVAINGVDVETGERFIGAMIGDHAKTGIGTILPTGCVLGVAANVFTRRMLPKFVPSFAWLTDEGLQPFRVEKAIEIARAVMARRKVGFTPALADFLRHTAGEARRVEAAGWAPSPP